MSYIDGKNSRDNFKKATIDNLAKRVGYLCSNPACRKLTVGAHANINKSTIIGVAAHITAASVGGPRYNPELEEAQRKAIENGIWLCNNCATLIDKDPIRYSVELLIKWKIEAENESVEKLKGHHKLYPKGNPSLEVDLIWTMGGRWNRGFSNKNPIELHDGLPFLVVGRKPIIHWALKWNFDLVIYNNSNYPAYNLKLESIGKEHFSYFDKLPKINNIPALEHIELDAKYEDYVEGDHSVADEILKNKIPIKFNDLCLKLTYLDDNRLEHFTYVEFKDDDIKNHLV